jgi:hypothetical protein
MVPFLHDFHIFAKIEKCIFVSTLRARVPISSRRTVLPSVTPLAGGGTAQLNHCFADGTQM